MIYKLTCISATELFYKPGTAKHGHVDPSVGPHGQLTIGYGSSGWMPQCFHAREGRPVDVGLLKLFVSTQWIDFSDIEQASPFDGYPRGHTSHSQPYISPNTPWDSISVPVVQRGAPTTSKNSGHIEHDRERKIPPNSECIFVSPYYKVTTNTLSVSTRCSWRNSWSSEG